MDLGFEIVAHRGSSYVAPENTLGAFRTAWKDGADGIEGDFRLTADGHVVCHHDEGTVLKAHGADGVGCACDERIDGALVRAIAGEGKAFNVWTVDDPAVASRLGECGITYLTTNRPGWMRRELGRMAC